MKKTILIQCENKPQKVRANIIGRFAVHGSATQNKKGVDYISEEWFSVTHISSGKSIMRQIESKRAAMDYAKRMDENLSEENIQAILGGDEQQLKRARSIISEWALEWGVMYSY